MTQPGQTTCPHCGQTYAMEPWQVGQRFACARCSQEFIAGGPAVVGYPMPGLVRQRANGMAIASLVCGIFFCFPLAGILALIFGIIGLAKTKDPNVSGKGMAIAGIVLGALGLVLLPAMMIPALSRARETANRIKCASNLRQIGQAIVIYTNNYNGEYPPDLGTLYKDQNMDLHTFVCPDTNTTPPMGMSIDQGVQWINSSSDYVYLGGGLKNPVVPQALVIYEKDSNHAPEGDNVLYADGHVRFLPVAAVHRLIAQNNFSGTTH